MKTLKLVDGDLVFDSNKELEMVSDDEEFAQNLRVIFGTRLGEFELDETIGLSRDHLLGKDFDEEQATYDIIEAASQEDRTEEVSKIEFNRDASNRVLNIDLEIKKTDGTTTEISEVDIGA